MYALAERLLTRRKQIVVDTVLEMANAEENDMTHQLNALCLQYAHASLVSESISGRLAVPGKNQEQNAREGHVSFATYAQLDCRNDHILLQHCTEELQQLEERLCDGSLNLKKAQTQQRNSANLHAKEGKKESFRKKVSLAKKV